MKSIFLPFVVLGLFSSASFASQLDEKINALTTRIDALESKNQSLMSELSNIKVNDAVPNLANKSFQGMGNGASKVYYSKSPLSIGGYGEIKYTSTRGGNDTTDVHRFIPYIGYRFSDNIIFNSEIEFEHGGAYKTAGEAIVEFAYIDFLFNDYVNVRAGHVLAPVGLTNLRHEPTLFFAVERPEVEKYIIPTTWHENGLLVYGSTSSLSYTVGLLNSFNKSGFTKSSDWIRGGRQGGKGDSDEADDFGYVGRVEFTGVQGLNLGVSGYMGKTAQSNTGPDGDLSIYSVHGEWDYNNLTVRGLYAVGSLEEAEMITPGLGEKVDGYYLTVGYDFMPLLSASSDKALIAFVRHSNYDLNAEVGAGVTKDDSLNKTRTTIGLNYKPVANVVVKLDYQMRKTELAEENDLLKAGLGFVF